MEASHYSRLSINLVVIIRNTVSFEIETSITAAVLTKIVLGKLSFIQISPKLFFKKQFKLHFYIYFSFSLGLQRRLNG